MCHALPCFSTLFGVRQYFPWGIELAHQIHMNSQWVARFGIMGIESLGTRYPLYSEQIPVVPISGKNDIPSHLRSEQSQTDDLIALSHHLKIDGSILSRWTVDYMMR